MLDILLLVFGISGVLAIAFNFLLELFEKESKKNFAWVNLYGCFALFSYSLYTQVWLFVVLNGFLILTGVFGLYKVYK